MNIKEALSNGYQAANKSLDLIKVVFLFQLVFGFFNLFALPQDALTAGAKAPEIGAFSYVVSLVFLLLCIVIMGGSIAYICKVIKNDNASLSDLVYGGKKYAMKMLRLNLWGWLSVVAILLPTMLLYSMLSLANTYLALAVAALPAMYGVYYYFVVIFLAPYAIVIDNQDVRTSIKTCKKIAKQNIKTFLMLSLLLATVLFGVSTLIQYILTQILPSQQMGKTLQMISVLIALPITAYLGVVMNGAFASFYLASTKQVEASEIVVSEAIGG